MGDRPLFPVAFFFSCLTLFHRIKVPCWSVPFFFLRQFQPTSREDLDNLLTPMLPAGLTDQQKRDKVKTCSLKCGPRMAQCAAKGGGQLRCGVSGKESVKTGEFLTDFRRLKPTNNINTLLLP